MNLMYIDIRFEVAIDVFHLSVLSISLVSVSLRIDMPLFLALIGHDFMPPTNIFMFSCISSKNYLCRFLLFSACCSGRKMPTQV